MSDFQLAKQAVSLTALVAHLGHRTDHFPSGERWNGCFDPSCKGNGIIKHRTSFKAEGYFRCWCCGKSGDVVRAASLAWGQPQGQAARTLLEKAKEIMACHNPDRPLARPSATPSDVALVVRQAFGMAQMSEDVRAVLAKRGIPSRVIDRAVADGLLLGLPMQEFKAKQWLMENVGSNQLAKAGLLSSEGNVTTACTMRPLWFRHGESFQAVGLNTMLRVAPVQYGRVDQPFRLTALSPMCRDVLVVKSPLEALSARALGEGGEIIGLPDASAWRKEHAKPSDWMARNRWVRVAFGGQPEQRALADEFAAHLKCQGVQCCAIDFEGGQDVNDMLMAR